MPWLLTITLPENSFGRPRCRVRLERICFFSARSQGSALSDFPWPPNGRVRADRKRDQARSGGHCEHHGHHIVLRAASIEVFLFPTHNRKAMLLRLLQHLNFATASIDISMYMLTYPDIAAAVLAANGRRVAVRIGTSRNTLHLQWSQMQRLFDAGIRIKVNNKKSYVTHDKCALVDWKTFMNGSFNWTVRALTNSKNIII